MRREPVDGVGARPVNRLVLVYAADGGVVAKLKDALKKAVGREDCALCEITYSPLGKRPEWRACEARLGVPIDELHRDELPAAWGVDAAHLPLVLLRRGDDVPTVLLSRDEIEACADVAALEAAIRARLPAATAASA